MAFAPKDWRNAPDATTPITAAALEDLEQRVYDGRSVSVDAVTAEVISEPAGTTENGFVVKAPSSAWGDGTAYGTAQGFMLLRDDNPSENLFGTNDFEPDRNVLFRVNGRDGGIGTTGGLHVAIGLRQHAGYVAPVSGAVWIQNYVDAPCLVLTQTASPATKAFVLSASGESTNRVEIASGGGLLANRSMIVSSGPDNSGATAVRLNRTVGAAAEGFLAVPAAGVHYVDTDQPGDLVVAKWGAGSLRLGGGGSTTDAAMVIGAGSVVIESNDASTEAIMGFRRGGTGSSETLFVLEGTAGEWSTGSAVGDMVIRHLSTTKRLWLGVGTAASEIQIDDGEIAFLGAAPAARQSVGAAATDAATTQTLANNLRTALINFGLAQT